MKDLSASTILQDVAVKGSNVAGEHAPEHALNLGDPMRFEPVLLTLPSECVALRFSV
jgi:hypothetical protein